MPQVWRKTNSRRGQGLRLCSLGFGLGAIYVGMAGCQLNQAAQRDLSNALQDYEQRRAEVASGYAGPNRAATTQMATPDSAVVRSPDTAHENPPQSLRDCILLALAQNPEILAAEEIARAKAEHVPQVTALPDPMLTTKTLPEPVRTAEGDNYFVLGVQQKFPAPAKLDRAGRAAVEETRMALKELQQIRLRVIADVKRAYFRAYVIDRTIEIDTANRDLLRGLIDAVRAQVAAGRRSQADVLRTEVELSTLESQLIELRQQRETAIAMLKRLSNGTSSAPLATAPIDLRTMNTRLEELLSTAAKHNPDLERMKNQIERDRQNVELARLAYWPDFTLGFEWMQISPRAAFVPPPNPQTGMPAPVNRMSENGSDNWAITFGLNLPIWYQKIEAGIREARSKLLASQHQYAATQNRVQFQVEDAYARVRAQQELAKLFQDTIIPQAQQTYEVSLAAYTGGTGEFLIVIDNWKKWLTFTVQYHRALGELERSVADLEEAIGLSLDEAETGS